MVSSIPNICGSGQAATQLSRDRASHCRLKTFLVQFDGMVLEY